MEDFSEPKTPEEAAADLISKSGLVAASIRALELLISVENVEDESSVRYHEYESAKRFANVVRLRLQEDRAERREEPQAPYVG
jgi:hypothetical protein